MFATLQGEATFAGTPSIFIRLQGCDVGCPWCDTKHTWNLDTSKQIDFVQLMQLAQLLQDSPEIDKDQDKWAYANADELATFIENKYSQIGHVVITGGEPAIYDLRPLCTSLEAMGKQVQIETSGTEDLLVSVDTWVTLSPKIDMPGRKIVLKNCVNRANEIKMPIGKPADIVKFKNFLQIYPIDKKVPMWLQPLSQNKKATMLCVEQALSNNWKVSLQTHKFIDIH